MSELQGLLQKAWCRSSAPYRFGLSPARAVRLASTRYRRCGRLAGSPTGAAGHPTEPHQSPSVLRQARNDLPICTFGALKELKELLLTPYAPFILLLI